MSTYVYGIVRCDQAELPVGVRGVGKPPRPLRAVREGELAAIVSDCPANLRPKRRDLLAHQQVLTDVGAGGAVLPMRFGSVSPDDKAVREALGRYREHYEQELARVDGRVEYNVKAAHHEEAVLRQILADDPAARALTEANNAAGGGSFQDRMRLGEMVAGGVQAHEARDARRIQDALVPCSERHSIGPDGTGWLVNLSFLIERDAVDSFLTEVTTLEKENHHLELRVSGPLPPYSFVQSVPAA